MASCVLTFLLRIHCADRLMIIRPTLMIGACADLQFPTRQVHCKCHHKISPFLFAAMCVCVCVCNISAELRPTSYEADSVLFSLADTLAMIRWDSISFRAGLWGQTSNTGLCFGPHFDLSPASFDWPPLVTGRGQRLWVNDFMSVSCFGHLCAFKRIDLIYLAPQKVK